MQVLLKQIPNDETIDMGPLFLRYTMDVATDFLFGRSTNSLENPKERFAEAFSEVQRMQNIFVRAGPANPIIPRTSFKKALQVLSEFIEPYIDEALRFREEKVDEEQSYTFLHALAESTQDRKVLRDQLVAMLLAGRVTIPCKHTVTLLT